MATLRFRWALAMLVLLLVAGVSSRAVAGTAATKQVVVPGEDRFTPFSITIHVGQKVQWTNNDADSHYVVSDDAFNTAGHKGVDHLLPPGASYTLKFTKPGVFPFYCRFHAALDAQNQPKAPGPFGGIQDSDGNFGTPMSGVVTVLP